MSCNLNDNLKHSAANYPYRYAFTFLDQSVTYQELDSMVDNVASGLYAKGIRKGDRVALLLGNCPEFITAYYGILRAGALVVPINPIFTSGEISYILSNSKAKAIIANHALKSTLTSLTSQLENLEMVFYTESLETEFSWEQLLQNSTNQFEAPSIHENDLAVVLYTSGTTGRPKGAMLSHRNMASNAESFAELVEFTEDDRIIAVLPMFHVFCMTVCINTPIKSGAHIFIVPKFNPTEVVNTIVRSKATLFAGVPTMYSFLLQLSNATSDDFSSIRACFSGGASLPVELLIRFQEKYKVDILEGYGLSETAPVTAFNPLKGVRKAGSIGLNIPSVINKVVDPNGLEVPIGEIGELVVQGPNVMQGYLEMPEATFASLKDGWFYTGDLAKMDEDGYLYIVDRIKDLIIVGGYNVYPREVEEVLYQHPAVVEAAVIGTPDSNFGESVKAFVVCNDQSVSVEEIMLFAKERLAKYKHPREIEMLSELPKNSTGKILRRSLRSSVGSK
ncbi:long-chain-fatty-acid--CoA ligase [Neobacillus sp. CF12]|uniref:long-chain-fatty-acid--CoA ligase n=1 Tax=Neobacillus sp. CF12 TaxID=3055864 RepID=UPI0025A2A21D|nr:long-chain-fatty-acid--CoA ligase [Neobacillus sp. CF12]MDM5328227.1 long-chain-fatty-acid--CoA ligase [Neobacillus sp. CF12]